MPFADLREYLKKLEDIGELAHVSGAHWNLEMGVLTELCFEQGGPALLFEDIPDYPSNYRVVSNICTTRRRVLTALEFNADQPIGSGVALLKEKWDSYQPVPPVTVSWGPVLENQQSGEDINLWQFPVPFWHELDGGRFIGTGDCLIVRDPDTGVVNVGTYRLQVHDRNTLGLWQAPTTDGRRAVQKYWDRGLSAPVAATFGVEPVLFLASGGHLGVPAGVPELEFTGYVRGQAVEVIDGPLTGLPIPATAEVAIEGELTPPSVEMRDEGPFGEYTGYYAGGVAPEPVVNVKALYYRNDPILLGAPPLKPVKGHYMSPFPSRMLTTLWARLDADAGGIERVRDIAAVGAIVVQIRQQDENHVQRVVDAITRTRINWRLFIIVDDDIDIDDARDVIWAVGSRFDPATGVSIDSIQSRWGLNPHLPVDYRKNKGEYPFARMIINACRPYALRDQLGPVNVFSKEMREQARQKWPHLLGQVG